MLREEPPRSTDRPTLTGIAMSALVLLAFGSIARPVVARLQSPSPDTADLLSVKMLATATLVYSADADDTAPLATAEVDGVRLAAYDFPAGWRTGTSDDSKGHWATAILPYIKAAKYYASPQAPLVSEVATKGGDKRPSDSTFAYNGLMSGYAWSQVRRPESVHLFGESFGFIRSRGSAVSDPVLVCAPGDACRYGAASSGRLFAADAAFLPPSRRSPVAFADGSARLIEWKDGAVGPKTLAWAELDAAGKPAAGWFEATGRLPLSFRPDYDPRADDAAARSVPR